MSKSWTTNCEVVYHLPILFSIKTSKSLQNSSPLKLKKRIFKENNLASFEDQISNINSDNLNSTQDSGNSVNETFVNTFSEIFVVNFSLTEMQLKPKMLKTFWFSNKLKKSPKTKQSPHIKLFFKKSTESEEKYKNYKNLFGKIKIKSKKN